MHELRVDLAAADGGGCGFYRILEPARVTRQLGVVTNVRDDVPVKGESHPGETFPRVYDVNLDCDVLVLQRPLLGAFHDVIRIAQKKGIAVVVELDDDFENVSQANSVWANIQPHLNERTNWKHVKKACLMADWVTVSTPALTRYAPHGRVSVLRNRVPQKYFDVPGAENEDKTPRVGWTGTLQTHPHDLQVTNGMVWRAVEETDSYFAVIGDGEGVLEALRIPEGAKVGATGWVDLDHYVAYVKLLLDVGIVPLEESKFNEAKSYIKGLEMAALGVPFVASPTNEYRYLAMHGIGVIAAKPRDWYIRLKKLITNADWREEVAANSREIARKQFTYENAAEDWTKAWLSALKHRREDRMTA